MSDGEVRAFLMSEPPHTGKLATTRKDGRPHVAPVWYTVDDNGDVVFTTGAETLKGRTLQRDPRCAMCVDDERPPFRYVIVNGTAELIEDLDQLRHWATILGGRYMGADQAEAFGARNAVPGELLVRLHPERTVTESGASD
jgi:PPOX class probable F420-dependent enzyme